jgi:hypothetical protein
MKPSPKQLQLTGGGRKEDRRPLDFYPTPPEVTIALMEFLKLEPMTIWGPACGNGAMSDVLKDYGHIVIETDLITGSDYLHTSIISDAIITNPPFNQSAAFIEKAVGEAHLVAMLLKSQYWHAKSRYELFNKYIPSYILPLTWRPDFLYQERDKPGSPTLEMIWTVWITGNTDAKYIPLKRPQ